MEPFTSQPFAFWPDFPTSFALLYRKWKIIQLRSENQIITDILRLTLRQKNKKNKANKHENPKFEKASRSSAILWCSVECADVELCASLLTVWRNAELTFSSANQDAGAEHGPVQWSGCKCFHCGWKQMRRGVASMRFTNQISINVTESANSRLWLRSGNNEGLWGYAEKY